MRYLRPALLLTVFLSLLTGLIYPLVTTGVAQLAFFRRANGSLVHARGRVVGSELIGQSFSDPAYFHGRPSASNYDATASGGSNLGPTSPDLVAQVGDRATSVRSENGLPDSALVPAELVLASASGLDPDISPRGAEIQVPRIAQTRGVDPSSIRQLIYRQTQAPLLGVFGSARVNVLKLNLALDSIAVQEPPRGGKP